MSLIERTATGEVPVGRYYKTLGGERIDQIAWQAYGRQAGAVEAILVVNPELAKLSYELPPNVAVLLPDLNVQSDTTQEVQLWS